MFKDKKLTILATNCDSKNVIAKEMDSFANPNFVNCLNLIKNNKSLLYRIFENASFSEAGIYMLKIFQSYEWRCIIIDDFIPVV